MIGRLAQGEYATQAPEVPPNRIIDPLPYLQALNYRSIEDLNASMRQTHHEAPPRDFHGQPQQLQLGQELPRSLFNCRRHKREFS